MNDAQVRRLSLICRLYQSAAIHQILRKKLSKLLNLRDSRALACPEVWRTIKVLGIRLKTCALGTECDFFLRRCVIRATMPR